MKAPRQYQQPENDQYPRLGRLLIVLIAVMVAIGLATWAVMVFVAPTDGGY